ncbi:BACON domain-containing protein [Apibacter sp. HY039]|uniref:BACON domain-containing protein n=1 Tax=Apibacter sp. HY039 TaxID=2501476 RepID=UPI000FEBCD82|nr:BACON domain-containing protein [Apibacter sp. HY039]
MNKIILTFIITILGLFSIPELQAQSFFFVIGPDGSVNKTPIVDTIQPGESIAVTVLSSGPWRVETPVFGATISPMSGPGNGLPQTVTITVDASAQPGDVINLTFINGQVYPTNLVVGSPPHNPDKFTCPTQEIDVVQGKVYDVAYTDLVKLEVNNPKGIFLSQGEVLGELTNLPGRAYIVYGGNSQTYMQGNHPLTVRVRVQATVPVGTYDINLNIREDILSECKVKINVKSAGSLTLNCGNATINPSEFTQGSNVNASVTIPYTATNPPVVFPGATVESSGVSGLTLTIPPTAITNTSGTLSGNITGTPTTSGVATFNIPGYCTVSVTVKASVPQELSITCPPAISVDPNKPFNEEINITYTLNYGTLTVPDLLGTLNGYSVKADPVGQVMTAPGGTIKAIVSGTAPAGGQIKIPIIIGNKTCEVIVDVKRLEPPAGFGYWILYSTVNRGFFPVKQIPATQRFYTPKRYATYDDAANDPDVLLIQTNIRLIVTPDVNIGQVHVRKKDGSSLTNSGLSVLTTGGRTGGTSSLYFVPSPYGSQSIKTSTTREGNTMFKTNGGNYQSICSDTYSPGELYFGTVHVLTPQSCSGLVWPSRWK